jgi:hypothetical protein
MNPKKLWIFKINLKDYIANPKKRFQNGAIIDTMDVRDLNLIK